ncbi:MAG: YegS/Rv2252/BmrU family lipid kinase [Ignavibacteriaceae bacterium]|nr:YegS/Rv2252/BmrU family lipid kinase [Ignavibacteriaceae bacterium]
MKTLLLVNPVSGKGYTKKILPEIQQKFISLGIHFEIAFSERPKHFFEKFPVIDHSKFDFLTVIGGDGFMNEVVNGFSDREKIPFLLIPAGSGNDIGRSLDINIKKFFGLKNFSILTKKYDILEITYLSGTQKSSVTRKFLSSCGAGFDAEVSKLSSENKVLRGLMLYLYSTLKALIKLNQYEGTVSYQGSEIFGHFTLITTGNTATAGGGFKLTPQALIDDGLADIMIAGPCTRSRLLLILPLAIIGNHIQRKEITYIKSEYLNISTRENVPIHADGEFLTAEGNDIRIRVSHQKLNFLLY